MGLSARKVKQRIPADPRNLSWADDASKFGQNYLSKFGWDSSKGLGAAGDGRTTHVKVSQKLDMFGIGAAHQKDPNGMAWKQNKDFENVLKRLNESAAAEETHRGDSHDDAEQSTRDGLADEVVATDVPSKLKKARKRKREDDRDVRTTETTKKRKKSKDKHHCDAKDESRENVDDPATKIVTEEVASAAVTVVAPTQPFVPRHRAHRARAIAAKSITSKSAASISEILGIAPTPSSVTASTSGTPQGTLTPLDDSITLETLTTSTKSVADYFKERLLSKSSSKSSTMTVTDTVPAAQKDPQGISDESPRQGLGFSGLRPDTTTNPQTHGIGISKFPALMSASFLASVSLASPDSVGFDHHRVENSEQKTERKIRKKSIQDALGDTQETKLKRIKEKKEKKEKPRKEDASPAADSIDQDQNLGKRRAEKKRKRDEAERKLPTKKQSREAS